MASILPGESWILARHHGLETGEKLLEVGPSPSVDGVAELQVICAHAMRSGWQVVGQHKTTPGGIDRDDGPHLLQNDDAGREGIKGRLKKLIRVPERLLYAFQLGNMLRQSGYRYWGSGVIGKHGESQEDRDLLTGFRTVDGFDVADNLTGSTAGEEGISVGMISG